MSDKIIEGKAHSFLSRERDGIDVSGVLDVVSFDESGVVMETSCGSMAVEGEGLHVTVLNLADGMVNIDGRISGVYYFDNSVQVKHGLFGKKK
jgi:sporulation protein YabP